jgi:hypothetical protein
MEKLDILIFKNLWGILKGTKSKPIDPDGIAKFEKVIEKLF